MSWVESPARMTRKTCSGQTKDGRRCYKRKWELNDGEPYFCVQHHPAPWSVRDMVVLSYGPVSAPGRVVTYFFANGKQHGIRGEVDPEFLERERAGSYEAWQLIERARLQQSSGTLAARPALKSPRTRATVVTVTRWRCGHCDAEFEQERVLRSGPVICAECRGETYLDVTDGRARRGS